MLDWGDHAVEAAGIAGVEEVFLVVAADDDVDTVGNSASAEASAASAACLA